MSSGPDEYPDITNKEPREKEIRTEPPEDKPQSYDEFIAKACGLIADEYRIEGPISTTIPNCSG